MYSREVHKEHRYNIIVIDEINVVVESGLVAVEAVSA
jgi:ATP:corrinoid adenosyltransferase